MSDIDQIENRVEHERAALANSLEALADAADPSRVMDRIATVAQSYGGEIGRQAWDATRQNPVAATLVGAGIGLLFLEAGKRPEEDRRVDNTSVPPLQAMKGQDARMAAADAEIKEEMIGMSEYNTNASRLREAFDHGIDALPAPARRRVQAARRAALHAQEQVEEQAARIARRSRGVMNDNPLSVGAVALGLGAVIGALLPSTRREDEILGARRDALMRAAQDAMSEELAKVHSAARSQIHDLMSDTDKDTPRTAHL